MIYPAYAGGDGSAYDQIVSTSDGTLDVGIYTIPKIPNRLPCLAVSGDERPLNARINRIPESK